MIEMRGNQKRIAAIERMPDGPEKIKAQIALGEDLLAWIGQYNYRWVPKLEQETRELIAHLKSKL